MKRRIALLRLGLIVFWTVLLAAIVIARMNAQEIDIQGFNARPIPHEPSALRLPSAPPTHARGHRFWDAQNISLMTAGAALRWGDIWTTKRFLRHGGREAVLPQGWVDSTPKFVAYHAIGQGIFTLAAWSFHRTRHHRLERAVLWIQAGTTAGFVVNNQVKFNPKQWQRR